MSICRRIASGLLFVGGIAVALASCESTSTAPPTAPPTAPAAPTVTGLALSGVDAVLTGVLSTYTATATMSDGTSREVTPTWTSSNPGVASVDSAGRVDGRAHGSTSLTAAHEGRSASKTVQVVNNYAGGWEGRFVVRACKDSGDLIDRDGGYCRTLYRVGNEGSIGLRLTQTGSNLSQISATLGLNELRPFWHEGKLEGVVTSDGRLNLGGTFSIRDYYGELTLATVHVKAWETNLSGPGVMTGRWSQHYTSLFFRIGTADTENDLVTMTRGSTTALPASASYSGRR